MKQLLLVPFLLFYMVACAQDKGKVKELDARRFQLSANGDTIDFILVEDRLDTVKPLLIYCQGSTPIPLVVQYLEGDKFIPVISAFNYIELTSRYHLVIISMPNTPFEARIDRLNTMFMHVQDTAIFESLEPSYLANNYLENYVSRANKVVRFLSRQKWVDRKNIYIVGHSQGAKVAIETAAKNKEIDKVCFLNGNPFGRTEHYIRLERYLSIVGKKTSSESQLAINRYYKLWKDVKSEPNNSEIKYGDPNIAWVSWVLR